MATATFLGNRRCPVSVPPPKPFEGSIFTSAGCTPKDRKLGVLPPITLTSPRWTVEAEKPIPGERSGGEVPQSSPRPKYDTEKSAERDSELVEARRALRGLEPGDWDAPLFVWIRQQKMKEGKWSVVAGLHSMVSAMTKAVVEIGHYSARNFPELSESDLQSLEKSLGPRRSLSNRSTKVEMPKLANVEWFGLAKLGALERSPPSLPPPLICSAETPIQAAANAFSIFPDQPVVMTMEATDFIKLDSAVHSAECRFVGAESRGLGQQEMFLCSNFDYHSRMATHSCSNGPSLVERLTAKNNPEVMAAYNVGVFRGPAHSGYPFHGPGAMATVTVLVSGRATAQPMFAKGETFAMKDDVVAMMDRLHLIAMGAVAAADKADGQTTPAVGGLPRPGRKPVLVMSAYDLTASHSRQPRQSIVEALQSWRQLYGSMFEAVVVACGDVQTATMFDTFLNGELYATALLGQQPAPKDWHWHVPILELSVNNVLARLGQMRDYMSVVADGQWKLFSRGIMKTTGHKASVAGQNPEESKGWKMGQAGMVMATGAHLANTAHALHAQNLPAKDKRRSSVAGDGPDGAAPASARRMSAVTSDGAAGEHGQGGDARFSTAESTSTTRRSSVGGIEGRRQSLSMQYKQNTSGRVTLATKKTLDNLATALEMPPPLKAHCAKMALKPGFSASLALDVQLDEEHEDEGDEEDEEEEFAVDEEAAAMFAELETLTAKLEPSLRQNWGQTEERKPFHRQKTGRDPSLLHRSPTNQGLAARPKSKSKKEPGSSQQKSAGAGQGSTSLPLSRSARKPEKTA